MVKRALTVLKGLMKRHGPSRVKMQLWDKEFSGTHWDFINDTSGDCVYAHLERHLKNGSLLDLGCGPGNTANELADGAYQSYVGVDISSAALLKAQKRTRETGRTNKNTFVRADFMNYVPTRQFNVILFRESMYHVPAGKVKALLERYSQYLTADGLFVVRMNVSGANGDPKSRLTNSLRVMESQFEVREQKQYGQFGPIVVVFRSKYQTDEKHAGATLGESISRAGQ